MIVRPHPRGWRVTLHPAHGLLAAELYVRLPPDAPGVPALPTLLAVADHDDHQLDFARGHYLTEAGAPQDFTFMAMDDDQRSRQAEALLRAARRKHRWTARLIGRHYRTLYDGQDVDARLRHVLDDIARFEALADPRADPSADCLEATYGRMLFCDRVSLMLAGDEAPAVGRAIEVNAALGYAVALRQNPDSAVVTLDPWPFHESAFEVGIESYVLEQLRFDDSAALGEAFAKTHPEWRTWALRAPDQTAPIEGEGESQTHTHMRL